MVVFELWEECRFVNDLVRAGGVLLTTSTIVASLTSSKVSYTLVKYQYGLHGLVGISGRVTLFEE